MDEKLARRLADEYLRSEGLATDEEWRAVRSYPPVQELAEGPTPEEDVALEAANHIRSWRWREAGGRRRPAQSIPRRSNPLSPPDWWRTESQRRLAAFLEQRVFMRVDAGLFVGSKDIPNSRYWGLRLGAAVSLPDEPDLGSIVEVIPITRGPQPALRSVAEITPFIHAMIRQQHKRFRELHGDEEPEWGWDPDDFLEYSNEIEFPAESWEQDGRTERVYFLPAGFEAMGLSHREPSLDRLHWRSMWIARELGITQAECLVWGLTDLPFTLPWMPTTVRDLGLGSESWSTIAIQVQSLRATAQEVAAAYVKTRGTPAPRPWPALVVAFVESRSREARRETWGDKFAAFAATYPDQKYKSMRTFRQAYYAQKKEAER